MFDMLLSMGAKLDIKNRQGLTPLTMAAKLPRKDVSYWNIHDISSPRRTNETILHDKFFIRRTNETTLHDILSLRRTKETALHDILYLRRASETTLHDILSLRRTNGTTLHAVFNSQLMHFCKSRKVKNC